MKNNTWIIGFFVLVIGAGFCYFFMNSGNQYVPQNISSNFTREMAEQISYSETTFSLAEKSRSDNIRLALSKLNEVCVLPNETFSLNETLGKRTSENGYKEAPVIVNGELVPGIGGGVCQVATTLYGAVIKTDATVVERKHHEFPPAYTKAGQDATIASDIIDFKFQNTTNYPFYIVAGTTEDKACVSIFSKNLNPNQKVEIESEMLNVVEPQPDEIVKDSTIAVGESVKGRSSKKGYEVAVYKNIYDESDNLISRNLISTDTYEPIRGITKIGATASETDDTIAPQEVTPNKVSIDISTIEEPDNPPCL